MKLKSPQPPSSKGELNFLSFNKRVRFKLQILNRLRDNRENRKHIFNGTLVQCVGYGVPVGVIEINQNCGGDAHAVEGVMVIINGIFHGLFK